MKILGVNDQHNASACLVEDGQVVAAVQEERFTRVKNDFRFPTRSIAWVLNHTGTAPEELDSVAIASLHITRPFNREQLLDHYARLHTPRTTAIRLAKKTPLMREVRRRRRAERLETAERSGLPVERVGFVDHHTAHAAAAYHGSGWKDEQVLVLTTDGEGDDVCASVRLGHRGRLLEPVAQVHARHSLGGVYSTMTFMMGMVPMEHEYKLMGMAPYAPPSGAQKSYEQFQDLFEFEGPDGLTWRTRKGVPNAFFSYNFLRERLRNHRFDWIAAGLQRFTEEHLLTWVRNAVAATGVRKLVLSGGVFMNVKANKRIYELPEVEDLYIFPSCGDETNSMGAAFQSHTDLHTGAAPKLAPVREVYWGPDIADEDVEEHIPRLRRAGYRARHVRDIDVVVADMLVDGQIVARAQGPMEFGARALGNRSILADPTRTDVVRIINDMIKNRDFWMPFAPSMLAEESDAYIVNPRKMDAPFMIMTFDTTERAVDFPAGIQSYDRTARPQLVQERHNPGYHRLISRFFERTGRAVVLNTSFNLHGYPIVGSASDAVAVLERSGLRHLAVANWLISKPAT